MDLRNSPCSVVDAFVLNIDCRTEPFNGVYTPPEWYLWFAGVDTVQCFTNAPTGQWISYLLFFFAELISIALGFLYYLGLWRPVRRGAQYLRDFNPPFPQEEWPTVCININIIFVFIA